jgi:hypothetical protein
MVIEIAHAFKSGDLVKFNGNTRIFHYSAGVRSAISITPKGRLTLVPTDQLTPRFCHDERHETPCPLPCQACAEECGGSR